MEWMRCFDLEYTRGSRLEKQNKRFVVIINLKFVVVDELAPLCFSSVVIAGVLINHIYSKLFVCCLFLWFYRWPFALCYNSSCTSG